MNTSVSKIAVLAHCNTGMNKKRYRPPLVTDNQNMVRIVLYGSRMPELQQEVYLQFLLHV